MRVGAGTVLGCGLLLATALAAACHVSDQYAPGPIVALTVSPDSMSLVVGDTSRAKAYPLDDRHTYVVGQTITWSSSNAAVASVDGTGLVRGVAPGGATVKAQYQTFIDSVVVDVQP